MRHTAAGHSSVRDPRREATHTVATKRKATATKAATKRKATKKTQTEQPVRARVTVFPRPEIPDPEGDAIRAALGRLGFQQVSEVRAGRSFEIALAGVEADSASDLLRQMCDRLLANAVAEEYAVELLGAGGGGKS